MLNSVKVKTVRTLFEMTTRDAIVRQIAIASSHVCLYVTFVSKVRV